MTKRFRLAVVAACAVLTVTAKDILVSTPNTSLLLKAEEGQPLHISYYGERIDGTDQVYAAYSLWEPAYPAFAGGGSNSYALGVRHADGNMSTELVYTGDRQTSEEHSTLHVISMRDKKYDLLVDVCYRAYDNSDVIETWTEIRNQEKKPVTLLKYASGFLPLRRGDAWVVHQHGAGRSRPRSGVGNMDRARDDQYQKRTL